MSPGCYSRLFEAFTAAKTLAQREELERQRRDPRAGRNDTARFSATSYNPTFRSEPRRDMPVPRQQSMPPAYNRSIRQPDPVVSHHNPRAVTAPKTPRDVQSTVWCRYCKYSGHEIQDCRKRRYNNARQGNLTSPPSRSDPPRTGAPPMRPIRPIETVQMEQAETPESESSD
ncbi:hypothetical protein ALC62_01854 [Cyphomyrmex costatus]|uniref:Uncharacterized protein n=1 Tax=Cyphomyrmex costatus TaxID=456900 RepID=A0A151IPC0_9HYME|nr:hypothetical protein ALC62_01854 [Cyphomyrmex costatus]